MSVIESSETRTTRVLVVVIFFVLADDMWKL